MPAHHDIGTDLLLQAHDDRGHSLRAIVGAQIKAGPSYFKEPVTGGWWYRDSDGRHLEEWSKHLTPHILILHSLDSGISYWVHVTPDKIIDTGIGAKVLVPSESTVDKEHFSDLVRVAVGDGEGVQWEGSAWSGGSSIAREDRLRFALLTPRLIAPHPNSSTTELSGDAAIALLIKMRLLELNPAPPRRSQAPSIGDAMSSSDWIWRFYAAAFEVLVNGRKTDHLQDVLGTTDKPHQVAAATALICALFIETGEPDRAATQAECTLAATDLSPVDYAWMQAHHVRALSEVGRLTEAYAIAQTMQQSPLPPNDPTAAAIAASTADLLFATAVQGRNVAAAVTGRDTLASWWRTQEVAAGLQDQWDDSFREWADIRQTSRRHDDTWPRLRAASLIAGLAADHTSWRHTTCLLAERSLTTAQSEAHLETALALLRRTGAQDSVDLAVNRLYRSGPLTPLIADVNSIDLERSSRTSIGADLKALEKGADLLTTTNTDRHIRFILDVLTGPEHFENQFHPNFWVQSRLLDLLEELTPNASDAASCEVIAHIIGLPRQTDELTASDYAQVLLSVPTEMWAAQTLHDLRDCANADAIGPLAGAITTVLATSDPKTRDRLRQAIRQGDLDALSAFGDVRDLDPGTVEGLIDSLSAKVGIEIADLQRGKYSHHSHDRASVLVLINAWHPDNAEWEPIIQLLTSPASYNHHLAKPLKRIRLLARQIPDDTAAQLAPILSELMSAQPLRNSFFGRTDTGGLAAAALAALRPDNVSETEIAALFNGDDARLIAAVQVLAAREHPTDLTALAVLAKNRSARVRAQVAFTLAHWITHGIATPSALALLTDLLDSPGALAAIAVSNRLAQLPPEDSVTPLATALLSHPSATVRRNIAEHLSGGTARI